MAKVGKPSKYRPHNYAILPYSVVTHVWSYLGAAPQNWYVERCYTDLDSPFAIADQAFESVCINQYKPWSEKHYAAVYVQDRWVWLGDAAGLAVLSHLYQSQLHSVSPHMDAGRLDNLCRVLACILEGTGQELLSEKFRRSYQHVPGGVEGWLKDKRQKPGDLLRYVSDPLVRSTPAGYTLTYHVATPQGSVKRLKIHCDRKETTLIRRIEVRTLEKPGTFVYPIVG